MNTVPQTPEEYQAQGLRRQFAQHDPEICGCGDDAAYCPFNPAAILDYEADAQRAPSPPQWPCPGCGRRMERHYAPHEFACQICGLRIPIPYLERDEVDDIAAGVSDTDPSSYLMELARMNPLASAYLKWVQAAAVVTGLNTPAADTDDLIWRALLAAVKAKNTAWREYQRVEAAARNG